MSGLRQLHTVHVQRDPVTFVMSEFTKQAPLNAGGSFPDAISVTAYGDEQVMTFNLAVEEGRIVLNSFAVSRRGIREGTDDEGKEQIRWGPEITPEMVHNLPLARFLQRAIEAAADRQRLTGPQAARARRRRGVDLQRVAAIVQPNKDGAYRQEIADEFDVSDRTASRLIARAKKEGLL